MDSQRRLTLLRHGEAHAATDGEDRVRRLTRDGIREAEEIGRRLHRRRWLPDRILASPASRTWATAEIVARACGLGPRAIRRIEELYAAAPDTIWRLAGECDDRVHHLLICGHNPGLAELASRFGPRPEPRRLPTGGLASAVWNEGRWIELVPELADECRCDDPARESPPPGRGVQD